MNDTEIEVESLINAIQAVLHRMVKLIDVQSANGHDNKELRSAITDLAFLVGSLAGAANFLAKRLDDE